MTSQVPLVYAEESTLSLEQDKRGRIIVIGFDCPVSTGDALLRRCRLRAGADDRRGCSVLDIEFAIRQFCQSRRGALPIVLGRWHYEMH